MSLNITNLTQVSIFATSCQFTEFWKLISALKKNLPYVGSFFREYSALAASKSIKLKDASILLKTRGDLMHSAIEPNTTSMAALIGLNCDDIEKIIKNNSYKLEIANDNSPGQVVVSGSNQEIENSEEIFISNGVKKFVKLKVSAAFHSKFMRDAQDKLSIEIDKVKFYEPICSIISNYDASINSYVKNIIKNLKLQMSSRVRWTESILKLEQSGETKVIEIGPGKVLSGLIKRISKKIDTITINNIEDLEKLKL